MKKFCVSLQEHATSIINFEKKKILPLKEELNSHQDVEACYICRKRILNKAKDQNY